ncbi:phospholipase A1-like isoform X2 [Anticarsia gemmatalis]|uniref:phospholipase A1-like isoform X2 n=1 Tax=Anticarsia gemmatalis TaxID=129554 RepID=UPI003F7602FD
MISNENVQINLNILLLKMLAQFTMILIYVLIKVTTITMANENDDYYFIADDKSHMRRVYTSESVNEDFIAKVQREDLNVYYLFTRKNPNFGQIFKTNDEESFNKSNFNATKTTVFIIHGWFGSLNSTLNAILKDAFLQDDDVNVIVVDWCAISCTPNYFTVVTSVPTVGSHIAKLIKWLTTHSLTYSKLHLVGHSLGAHIAGNIGKETKAKVQRITDPAGPYWYNSPHRLAKSDAQYVEVIHTNTKCLGYKTPCGDADFYPNGGKSMPGCRGSSCSHSKSYHYMAYSVKHNNMYSSPCQDMKELDLDTCEGEPYLMGNSDLFKNRTGLFRVDTNLIFEKDVEYRIADEFTNNFKNRRFLSAYSDCRW